MNSNGFENMENFTPGNAIIGGVLIGISSTILLLINGRIAGISGIAASLTDPKNYDAQWRLIFLFGLVGGATIYRMTGGNLQSIEITTSFPVLIIAGLLTGIGTKIGNGCTSGHGISGLARLSPRSFVSVVLFLSVAILTFYVTRYILVGLL